MVANRKITVILAHLKITVILAHLKITVILAHLKIKDTKFTIHYSLFREYTHFLMEQINFIYPSMVVYVISRTAAQPQVRWPNDSSWNILNSVTVACMKELLSLLS